MSGSGPDDLNEEPDINANPAIDPPTPQGFEEVFSLFKTYLETRLEQKGKELEELAGKIKEANAQRDHKKVAQLTDQTKVKAGFHMIADDRGSQTITKRAVSI